MRVRLKADGRLVEILFDGTERPIAAGVSPVSGHETQSFYARKVRAKTKLTQAAFAAGIGVPIETVRNWEQGKRSPRGPARALLKLIDQAPDLVFAALAPARPTA